MIYPPVLTKHDFVRRYARGEFGNASPTWNNYREWWEDWQPDGWETALYHVRNRVAGGRTWYNVGGCRLGEVWDYACSLYQPSQLYISAMCPTELTTLQGEVRRSERYLDLTYTTVAKPMRDALAESTQYASGVLAVSLLRSHMNPKSYDWLQELFDRYPDHVVEFTCLDTCWGTLPGYNTIFWEVRSY